MTKCVQFYAAVEMACLCPAPMQLKGLRTPVTQRQSRQLRAELRAKLEVLPVQMCVCVCVCLSSLFFAVSKLSV